MCNEIIESIDIFSSKMKMKRNRYLAGYRFLSVLQ